MQIKMRKRFEIDIAKERRKVGNSFGKRGVLEISGYTSCDQRNKLLKMLCFSAKMKNKNSRESGNYWQSTLSDRQLKIRSQETAKQQRVQQVRHNGDRYRLVCRLRPKTLAKADLLGYLLRCRREGREEERGEKKRGR